MSMYFWIGDQPVVCEQRLYTSGAVNRGFVGMPCIDAFCTDPKLRYGVFTEHGWESMDISEFPPAFQAYALIVP